MTMSKHTKSKPHMYAGEERILHSMNCLTCRDWRTKLTTKVKKILMHKNCWWCKSENISIPNTSYAPKSVGDVEDDIDVEVVKGLSWCWDVRSDKYIELADEVWDSGDEGARGGVRCWVDAVSWLEMKPKSKSLAKAEPKDSISNNGPDCRAILNRCKTKNN